MWANSGYGNQTKILAPRFMKLGHQVANIAHYGHSGSPIEYNGVTVYGNGTTPYAQDVMAAHANHFKADFILSNMDTQMFVPEMLIDKKWVSWTPIDGEPCPPMMVEKLRKAFYLMTFSKFGQKLLEAEGMEADYVPYGYDPEVFYPGNKEKARQTVGWPMDKFVVGAVGMNRGYRKSFHQNIMAFAKFHQEHKDTMLYLHTTDGQLPIPDTMNYMKFCEKQGLKIHEDVIFADQYTMVLGYPEAAMNTLYNAMDVYMLVSMGEGFGLPILEAQACGVPVIVGDWTSMGELCFGGWKVAKKDAEPVYNVWESFQYMPHVDAIVEKLEAAYQMRGNTDYSKRALAGAQQYEIDRVVSRFWVPTLEKIEARLKNVTNVAIEENMKLLR